jgi:tripartite-type tricarboxylate transporter receptor subunit TctC
MGPHLYPRLGYDPLKDLLPVAQSCHVCNGVMARPDLPAANLREALDLARRKPGELVYGSPGNGTSGHLVAEYLKHNAGVQMQHVPYRGTAPMMTDLLALPGHFRAGPEGPIC